MKATVITGIVLLVIGGAAWGDPPRSGDGREPATPEEARNHGPGGGRHGEPGKRGERRGPSRGGEMAARMMQSMDANKDGTISFEEFRSVEKMADLPEAMQRSLFRRFDKDQDGTIVRGELPSDAKPSWMGGPGEGIRKLDINQDGRVSKPEFFKSPRVANIPVEKRGEIFQRMDRNADGFIDGRDHHRGPRPGGMPGRGRPPMDPARLRAELDKNKDGAVTFEELNAHPRFETLNGDQRKDLFEKMDRNGDQKIDAADSPEGAPRERMRPRPEGGRGDHERRGPDQSPDA